jgi:hypothetical protein
VKGSGSRVRSRDKMVTKHPNRVEIEGRREVEVGNGKRRNPSVAAKSTLHRPRLRKVVLIDLMDAHVRPIPFVAYLLL